MLENWATVKLLRKNGILFGDVEAFLADHAGESQSAEISEGEAAEALSVAWKDRRQEIQRHQQSRRFGNRSSAASTASSRSFRIEVEELKKKTKCRKCGKVGHWARECRSNVSASSAKEPSSSTSKPAMSADLVECSTLDGEISCRYSTGGFGDVSWSDLLTRLGGYRHWMWSHIDRVSNSGRTESENWYPWAKVPLKNMLPPTVSVLGNGQEETSVKAVRIPVAISGTQGLIDAAVISGQAPLLLGRPTLEKLKVRLDFSTASMKMLNPEITSNMITNEAGQLLVNILDFKQKVHPSLPSQPSADAKDQESRVGTVF